jgi:hypothetical protein
MIKLIGVSALALGFILHFLEWLYDFHLNGWSFATVLSVALLIERIHHDHHTRVMLKIIGEKVGVEWQSYLLENGLKNIYPKLLRYSTKPKEKRKKTMTWLTNSISKKLLALFIGVAVTALNSKFNLQISENDIYILFAGVIAYVLGQSHVDAKKIIASSVHAAAEVANEVEPVEAPLMSFQELIPYINEVGTSINLLTNDLKTGKPTEATKEAINAIMSIHAFLKKGA